MIERPATEAGRFLLQSWTETAVVIFDRKRKLFSTTAPADPPKPNITIAPAQRSDLKLISEWTADQMVEQWKIDPRRAYPEAHKERCLAVIDSGRQLVARDKGHPVFIAETIPVEERTAYMAALEAASVDNDIRPFTTFLATLVKANLEGKP